MDMVMSGGMNALPPKRNSNIVYGAMLYFRETISYVRYAASEAEVYRQTMFYLGRIIRIKGLM